MRAEDCVFSFCKTGKFPFQRQFGHLFKPDVINLPNNGTNEEVMELDVINRASAMIDSVSVEVALCLITELQDYE